MTESAVMFFTVFILGCLVVLAFYSYNKTGGKIPQSYQYSQLSQYDTHDPIDEEDFDDSSGGNDEIVVPPDEESSSSNNEEEEEELNINTVINYLIISRIPKY